MEKVGSYRAMSSFQTVLQETVSKEYKREENIERGNKKTTLKQRII